MRELRIFNGSFNLNLVIIVVFVDHLEQGSHCVVLSLSDDLSHLIVANVHIANVISVLVMQMRSVLDSVVINFQSLPYLAHL